MARRSDHSRDELTRMALAAARKIIAKQGLRGLSTRQIAAGIGYSPGTLYQLFEDLDDLILHINAATLDGLIEACRDVDLAAGPEAALEELARRYISYVGNNRGLWNAVFEHSLPEGRIAPDWLRERTRSLLGLAERAIAPLFQESEEAARRHEAQVLWASLYGIAALATAGKLPPGESPETMVQSLVQNSVAGLRSRRARP
ncbi:MAG: TetR/AcrR family transcriptional regulator [Rhizobiales bacterium]|nr:TetR/AcrR family transcriptional regulator [Hyphomicrobiales bacterium]MBI3672866.1 TetR/AcrR family transcriptional regulator [Hyphomicrobiales bacterium]